jgi:multidrug efflux pump subunit AcrB
MMTTNAALFGALPLAIGFGEGGEIRRPLASPLSAASFSARC